MLNLVTCGGHAATHLVHVVPRLVARGWTVCVIATPTAARGLDLFRLERQTGQPVRHDHPGPGEPELLRPHAVTVVPASFDLVNAWAAGVGDSLANSVLHEAVGLAIPTIAVPYPTTTLARHPAFLDSIDRLRSWGVELIFDPHRHPLPTPGMGSTAARLFPWPALDQKLAAVWSVVSPGRADAGPPMLQR